jgi:cytochrome c biogenesis protein CcdA
MKQKTRLARRSVVLRSICAVAGFSLVFAAFPGVAWAAPTAVPEIDPQSARIGLGLLIGGMLLLTGGLRRKGN